MLLQGYFKTHKRYPRVSKHAMPIVSNNVMYEPYLHTKSDTWWDHFKSLLKKKPWSIEETRSTVLETETAGLHPKKNEVLSMGTERIRANCILVSESFVCFLIQGRLYTRFD